jgi:hypothetical protein
MARGGRGFWRRLAWFGLLYALGLALVGGATFGLRRVMDAVVGPAAGAEVAAPGAGAAGSGSPRPTVPAGRATFDIVRVAPDGQAVIAGHAPAGATVEVTLDGRSLGTAVADGSGSWLLLPERAVPQGRLALGVRIVGAR